MSGRPRVLSAVSWFLLAASATGFAAPAAARARVVKHRTSPSAEASETAAATASAAAAPERELIGKIEIPRLGLSAVVREGADDDTLRIAVGHIHGTALPGPSGNVGLAAHRNTFFRPLKDVQMDDRIVVKTPTGEHRYRVASIGVVEPKDVWVLDPTEQATLTLVTCYPFDWIGEAPHRLIVKAVADEAASVSDATPETAPGS